MTGVLGGNRNGPALVAATDRSGEWYQRVLIAADDSPSVDAFGRWRVSEPQTLFDSKQVFDNQPLLWDDAETAGSGTGSTHSTATASSTLTVGNETTGTRVRQTLRRMAYQPGKSQLVMVTFVLGAAATGITRRVGLFDADNGLFLEQTAAGLSLVVRSSTSGSPVDTGVAQASWSEDTLDGTGVSGVTLDPTKTQILIIDFEWLGVGSVRMGFVVDGIIYWAHHAHHANSLATVYMSTPNLPVRYEVANDGTGPAASLVTICSTVMSEGGLENTGTSFSVDRGVTPLVTLNDADLYPLLAVRLKTTHIGVTVRPAGGQVVCDSTATFRWALLVNPTVAGTALSYSDVANNAVQEATGALNTTKVSGGRLLASGYATQSKESRVGVTIGPTDFALGAKIDGTRDELVLAVQRIAGTTESFYGSLELLAQV